MGYFFYKTQTLLALGFRLTAFSFKLTLLALGFRLTAYSFIIFTLSFSI